MREQTPMPQIFNAKLRRLRRARAARREGDSFLLRRCAKEAASRLCDINRQFESAIIIGLPDFSRHLIDCLPEDKRPKSVVILQDYPEAIDPKSADLLISGLVLQSLNHVPQAMQIARQALRPDGLFLGSILGGESLLDLRRACFAVDMDRFGGVKPRVAPMIDMQQAAGLLGSAGFAMPVIDKDNFTVKYKSLKTFICDLRDIGETNALSSQAYNFLGRDYLANLAQNIERDVSNGKSVIKFDVIWMTGWSPDKSQPKPLKPGSAKTNLADALKAIRDQS